MFLEGRDAVSQCSHGSGDWGGKRGEWVRRKEREIWQNINGCLDKEHLGVHFTFLATLMKI